ncbi:MAG TPA: primosomal protein N' [Candidatus Saccharimonadaceae bacterium]|jgi:primosomal protein N' (replication factor Y)|nr:primosomal protein N' [Candidatus Saccharimonadaceae bacterium]
MPFAEVALPLPLRRTFLYRIPESLEGRVTPGAQVEAPFRGRAARGVVVGLAAHTDVAEVRDLNALLPVPPVSAHLMALARWIADYYLAPIGEVLAAMLPGGLEGFAGSRARKNAGEDVVLSMPMPERRVLTAAQREAVRWTTSAVRAARFAPAMLHGVTASGKTEVYLRGAHAAREAGGQTLVLVPEVALGSQVVAAFRQRFGGRVGVLHSYLGVGERRRNWELARRGALDVVVGARSAIFAPLPQLKLIVVDEEHEPAYKQSEQLRYHGRDVAVRRAQLLGIPVLLGSATPSLETLANAARGKYTRLRLPERIDRRALPVMRIVDLTREASASGVLSRPLGAALAERLARGEQAVLFLNRRGHSHHTQCRACGFVPECPNCDITLTLHLAPREWRCHYCDHREPAPESCPRCHAALLRLSGAGTQRVERELAAALPGARVLRLDTDVARTRARPARILEAFARGEADVLLGTQMIAKGLDFPRVTLVGVLDADVALHLPDFRAAERTFQLLVQVGGRAGRGLVHGEVFVQTCTPDHPAIAAALTHDARPFLETELAERRSAGYPPYTRLAAVLFSGASETEVEGAAEAVAEAVRPAAEALGVDVLGPAPQALARLRGRFRWHLLLKGTSGAKVREAARLALEAGEARRGSKVRVAADVDPVEVL